MFNYNPMTCENMDTGLLGSCSMFWLSFAITLFLAMILRRQCDDGFFAGIGYNFIGALVGGLGLCLLAIVAFGDPRWSLLGGIVGVAAGGFGIGLLTGGSE